MHRAKSIKHASGDLGQMSECDVVFEWYHMYLYFTILFFIKTHDSELRGQEEAGRMRRMSVLFTGSTGVKFVNALNKLPLQLSLSYHGLSTF